MANHVNARHMVEGTKFVYRGRTLTATSVGKFQGTVKVTVEGYKFPLNLAPLESLEIVEDSQELATV